MNCSLRKIAIPQKVTRVLSGQDFVLLTLCRAASFHSEATDTYAMLLPPGKEQVLRRNHNINEYWELRFSASLIPETDAVYPLLINMEEILVRNIGSVMTGYLHTAWQSVYAATAAEIFPISLIRYYLQPLLPVLLMPAADAPTDEEASQPIQLVNKARQYIESAYAHPVTLKEVAGKLYVNTSYLSRTFHAYTGQTFTEYLRDIRLYHAKHMLAETTLMITDIADLTGFASSAHLSNVFHKHVGVSPKEYRTSKRNHPKTNSSEL